jgi:hypothetical protein
MMILSYHCFKISLYKPEAIFEDLPAYCLFASRLKERRFAARYGEQFHVYRAEFPYRDPRQTSTKDDRRIK